MTQDELNQISVVLDKKLKPLHGDIAKLKGEVEKISQTQETQVEKLDILTAEMHETRQTSKATHELLTHYVEKHEKEVKEIKKFVEMPLSEAA